MKKYDILVMPISETQVRMVTHLDVTPEMIATTCEVIASME
jgi:threonine aldolase